MPPTPTSKSASSQKSGGGGPYYAWNTFVTEYNEYGVPTDKIEPGEPITQSDLDVSDEEWESLIETGAVSEEEYPDIPSTISPAEYQAEMDTHEAMKSVVDMHEAAMEEALAADDEDAEPQPVTQTKPGTSSTSKS